MLRLSWNKIENTLTTIPPVVLWLLFWVGLFTYFFITIIAIVLICFNKRS